MFSGFHFLSHYLKHVHKFLLNDHQFSHLSFDIDVNETGTREDFSSKKTQ